MIRSRLIFVLLFLAYLGVTPAGVYTCVCLVPAQPVLQQVSLDEHAGSGLAENTAVSALLSFFSLSFAMMLAFLLDKRPELGCCFLFEWRTPSLFSEPPPTPPPHIA